MEKERCPQHCPAQVCPCPRETMVGVGAGDRQPAALLARCFSVNFYGMQKEFLFYFGFFVKLKQKIYIFYLSLHT